MAKKNDCEVKNSIDRIVCIQYTKFDIHVKSAFFIDSGIQGFRNCELPFTSHPLICGSTGKLYENGYFRQSPRQAQILILKIFQCILAVNPAKAGRIPPLRVRDLRLDLAKNLSFSASFPAREEESYGSFQKYHHISP